MGPTTIETKRRHPDGGLTSQLQATSSATASLELDLLRGDLEATASRLPCWRDLHQPKDWEDALRLWREAQGAQRAIRELQAARSEGRLGTEFEHHADYAGARLERIRCLARIGAWREAQARFIREVGQPLTLKSLKAPMDNLIGDQAPAELFRALFPQLQMQRLYRNSDKPSANFIINCILTWLQILINQWQYDEAEPLLEYLNRLPQISARCSLRQIDRLNVISAQIATWSFLGRGDQLHAHADVHLRELADAEAWPYFLRAQRARAQWHWECDETAQLNLSLDEIEATLKRAPWLGDEGTTFALRLWRRFAERQSLQSDDLQRLRQEAVEVAEWESLRDIDLYAWKVHADQDAYHRLVLRTPYAGFPRYVDRLRQGSRDRGSGSHRLRLELAWRHESVSSTEFDFHTGEFSTGLKLRPQSLNYRLLHALLKDAYRPIRTAELFFELFPDEYFDTETSTKRVQQVVQRFRATLAPTLAPTKAPPPPTTTMPQPRITTHPPIALEILALPGSYMIDQTRTQLCLTLSPNWSRLESHEMPLVQICELISSRFARSAFSARDLSVTLKRSLRSTQNLLTRLVEHQRVQRTQAGRATRYILAEPRVDAGPGPHDAIGLNPAP